MPTSYTATWNTASGNWSAAGNWNIRKSDGTFRHSVPDANADVVFPAGDAAYDVTYDTTDTINSLTGTGARLDLQGGSLTVNQSGSFAGTLNVAAGATFRTAATQQIGAGTLAGTVSGDGTLVLGSGGDFTFGPGLALTVSDIDVAAAGSGSPTSVALAANLTYGGNLTIDSGAVATAFDLRSFSLTLSGNGLLSGSFDGSGTLDITGRYSVHPQTIVTLTGVTLDVGGDLNMAGSGFDLQGGRLLINKGATFEMGFGTTVFAESGGTTENNGTVTVDDGGTIYGSFTNTGLLTVQRGRDDQSLVLQANAILGGKIGGAGTLEIVSQATIATSVVSIFDLQLDAGSRTNLTMDTTFRGGLTNLANSRLDLSGHTVTLQSGGVGGALDGIVVGTGTIVSTGSLNIGGRFGAGVTIEIRGISTQDGVINALGPIDIDAGGVFTVDAAFGTTKALYGAKATLSNAGQMDIGEKYFIGGHLVNSGAMAVDAAVHIGSNGSFVNESGGTVGFDLTGSLTIAGGTGMITNGGTLEVTDGTKRHLVRATVDNAGTITATTGTLEVTGAVSGAGKLSADGSGVLAFDGGVAAGQTMAFGGNGGHLLLNDALDFQASIAIFQGSSTIALGGFDSATRLSYQANQDPSTGGTLTVRDGTMIASLHLVGQSYASINFVLEASKSTEIIHLKPS